MHNCDATSTVLHENWLDINSKVRSLNLDSRVQIIEEGAFKGTTFSETHTIIFRNAELTKLEPSIFLGLSSLTTLSFYNGRFSEITGDAFVNLVSLHTLNLDQNLHPISLQNITGSALYPSIWSVSLRFNQIVNVPRKSFVGVPKLRNIYLTDSRINWIDSDAFVGAGDDIMDFYLNDNSLSTLESGVFSEFVKGQSFLQVYLEGNPWVCDCTPGMRELQVLMASPQTVRYFPGDVLCHGPKTLTDVKLSHADLGCIETSSSPSLVTPSIVTTLQPTPGYNTTPLDPTPESEKDTPPPNTTASIPSSTQPHTDEGDGGESAWTTIGASSSSSSSGGTRPPYPNILYQCPIVDDEVLAPELTIFFDCGHRFNLTEVEEGVVLVEVNPFYDSSVHLFWFMNTFLEFDPGHEPHERTMPCRSDLRESLRIEGLNSDSIYTFCMVPIMQHSLSPFHCLSIYLQPSKADRPWLKNRDRMTAYMIIAVSILCVFVLGIILAYLCLRRLPKVFGRKTKTSSQDVMIMPPLPKRNATRTLHKK